MPDELKATDFSVFCPLVKVDYQKREVWGRMTQEVPDGANEIADYASSKAEIQKWSAAAKARTSLLPEADQSLGNVREMHGSSAAGKVIDIDYNDAEKAVDIGTHIADDAAWNKVLKGVYTGFSVGGRYGKRSMDPKNPGLIRYTAIPVEVSLVDAPAVPTATFKLIKADGSTELHKIGVAVDAALETHDPPDAVEGTPSLDSVERIPGAQQVTEATAEVSNPNVVDTSMVAPISAPLATPIAKAEAPFPTFDAAVHKLTALKKTADDEKSAAEAKLSARGSSVGIARRAGEPLTPPKDYPANSNDYADPANHAWPVDTKARAQSALAYFNGGKGKEKYSGTEWNILGRRIASRASTLFGTPYAYSAQDQHIESTEAKKMEQLSKAELSAMVQQLQQGMSAAADQIDSNPSGAQDMLIALMGNMDSRKAMATGVNPAVPAALPVTAQVATQAVVTKADAPANDMAEVDKTDAVKALDAKVDKLADIVSKFIEAQTPSPAAPSGVQKAMPVGDILGMLANQTPVADPILEALTSNGAGGLMKAAQLAGTPERPDITAVYDHIDKALNESLKTKFTQFALAKGYGAWAPGQ